MRYNYILVNIESWWGCRVIGALYVVRMQSGIATLENILAASYKVTLWPRNITPRVLFKIKEKIIIFTNVYSSFIHKLQELKSIKMCTTGECIEYGASIYNEILLSNITIWVNLKHAKGWKPYSNGHMLDCSIIRILRKRQTIETKNRSVVANSFCWGDEEEQGWEKQPLSELWSVHMTVCLFEQEEVYIKKGWMYSI